MQRKMDANLFRLIKLMTKDGATIPETAECFKISPATVSRVRQSENLDEYYAILAAMHTKMKEKKAAKSEPKPEPEPVKQVVEHRQSVTIQATHYMMTEMQKTNELLDLISRKLAFIVDALS